MKRALGLFLLLLPALAHTSDLEVDHIRILTGREGTFLELQVSYPLNDTLWLKVVRTDRSRGVFEAQAEGGYREVEAVPIPYGVSNFGLQTPYRIRLVGGSYKPGEEVPVTLLFPAGALLTLPATVEAIRSPLYPPFLGLAVLASLALFATLAIRRRRGARRPVRAR